MNNSPFKAVMIWTPEGTWQQQTVNGIVRSSWLGNIGSARSVQEWAEAHGMEFEIFQAFRNSVSRVAAPASSPSAKTARPA